MAGLLVGVGAVLILALSNQSHSYAGTVIETPKAMYNFQLQGPEDRLIKLSDYRGKYVLLFFGYTSCPDVCPATLRDLAGVLKQLGNKADQVQILFISVDPEKDTSKRLAGYIKQFDTRIIGLTGSLADIQQTAREYGIFFQKVPSGTEGAYTVDHTATTMLLDTSGDLRIAYPYGITSKQIAEDIAYMLR